MDIVDLFSHPLNRIFSAGVRVIVLDRYFIIFNSVNCADDVEVMTYGTSVVPRNSEHINLVYLA